MKVVYEECSEDRKRRFLIYEEEIYFSVVLEQFYEELEIQGYIEPSGFKEVRDGIIHHVGTIDEGIKVGRELLRNM